MVRTEKILNGIDFHFFIKNLESFLGLFENAFSSTIGVPEKSLKEVDLIINHYNKILGCLISDKEIPQEVIEARTEIDFSNSGDLERGSLQIKINLLKAVKKLLLYISKSVDEEHTFEIAKLGAETNKEFTDFLIKICQSYDFNEDQLVGSVKAIFRSGLNLKLDSIGQGHLRGGILAVAKALPVIKEKFPEAKIESPTIEEDMKHKVDLKCQIGNQISLFQIKSRKHAEQARVFSLPEDEAELYQLAGNDVNREEVKKIKEYAASQTKACEKIGKKFKAYWVQVMPEVDEAS